jgi:hypothetical protein
LLTPFYPQTQNPTNLKNPLYFSKISLAGLHLNKVF